MSSISENRPSPSLLEIRGLLRRFGKRTAVDSISFEIRPGEILGLLGPNGAGKSTTFHLLTGLLRPDAGEIFWQGNSISSADTSYRARIGVVFQKPSVDVKLTGRENLQLGADLYAVPGGIAKERIAGALERTGLTNRADEPVERYSGGMRRRLELARVLLSGPRLLILDEPTQGLDQGAFRNFWESLVALRRKQGVSILLTTHFPQEAEYCDRIAVMDGGKIIACDTPDNLRAKVGGDVLVVEASEPEELAAAIGGKFKVKPSVLGEEIHFEHEKAHELVPRLVEAFPAGRFRSISMHRPTLADVFIKLTGRTLEIDTGEKEAAA